MSDYDLNFGRAFYLLYIFSVIGAFAVLAGVLAGAWWIFNHVSVSFL